MCGSMKGPVFGGVCLTVTVLIFVLAGAHPEAAEAGVPELGSELGTAVWSSSGSSAQEHPGKATFRLYCVPCHGEKGQGNGPAAVAFKPPPANFTNPDGLATLTDEQVIEVITKGRGSMPAWGPILPQEQLGPLVAYLRELSRGEG